MTVAVILAGCGVYDGSEIYEATLTMLYLDQADVAYECLAPDMPHAHVINHLTGEEMPGETRNVLVEAARLARGQIKDLGEARPQDYDAVIVPGGFGVAKNLCDFAFRGADMQIQPEVASFIKAMHKLRKPVGLICIAPTMAARLFGEGTLCTIGSNTEVAAAISAMGGQHQVCSVEDVAIDEENRLVTTPAYMEAGRIREAASGIQKLVNQIIAMSAS